MTGTPATQPPQPKVDITRAELVTPEVGAAVDEIFTYQDWDSVQKQRGAMVKNALASAVKVIIDHVPPCPTRSVAIRKLIEARMDCNAAITHRGKY